MLKTNELCISLVVYTLLWYKQLIFFKKIKLLINNNYLKYNEEKWKKKKKENFLYFISFLIYSKIDWGRLFKNFFFFSIY